MKVKNSQVIIIIIIVLKCISCQGSPCFRAIHCRSSLFKKRNRHKLPMNVCARSFSEIFPKEMRSHPLRLKRRVLCQTKISKDIPNNNNKSLSYLWSFSLRLLISVSYETLLVYTVLLERRWLTSVSQPVNTSWADDKMWAVPTFASSSLTIRCWLEIRAW